MVDFVGDESVDYIKRVGVVDSTGTTNLDGGVAARCSGVLNDVYTLCLTLEGLQWRRYGDVVDVLGTERSDRTGNIALALNTVTDYHEFVERCCRLFECYI